MIELETGRQLANRQHLWSRLAERQHSLGFEMGRQLAEKLWVQQCSETDAQRAERQSVEHRVWNYSRKAMAAELPASVVGDEPAKSHAKADSESCTPSGEKKKTKSKAIRRKQATFHLNAQEFSFVNFGDLDDTLHLAP